MGKNGSRCGDDDDDLPALLRLPEDCLIKILVCLPVKSLLRFKSICKSWRELIHSSFFIDLHTTTTFNSSSSSKFGAFILQITKYLCQDGGYVNMFMISSGDGGVEEKDDEDNKDNDDQIKMDDLEFLPFYNDFQLTVTLRMVGSCNGIICLYDPKLLDITKGCSRQHYLNLRDVSLWNPATRQFRILPKSIPVEEKQDYSGNYYEDFIAFGFDVKTKDYKVLRITPWNASKEGGFYGSSESMMCRVQVYSLSTDTWRLLEGINYLPAIPNKEMDLNHGIYMNGSYFFVGRSRCYFMLMSFDFTNEIFTTIQLPNNVVCAKNLVLSCLDEKLAVFTFEMECDYEYYDIWVLYPEQHGSNNMKFWIKLHSFRIENRGEVPNSIEERWSKPRCISNNGEFALISTRTDDGRTNKLQLFNLVTKEAKKDLLFGTWGHRAEVYKESLVSIIGGNGLLKWQLPTTHGITYRLNLDAHFVDSSWCFGIGLCLTSDDTGACIGVRSLVECARDATEGEALAMLGAIKWAKKLELSPIVIESNSKNCISFFMDDDDDDDDNNLTYWSLGALSLLREAKVLLKSSSKLGISFQYCSRSCNYVADAAAKLAGDRGWACKEWTADFPGEMVRSLSKDLGLVTSERVRSISK